MFNPNDIVTPAHNRGFYNELFGKEYTVLKRTGRHITLVEIGEDALLSADAWELVPQLEDDEVLMKEFKALGVGLSVPGLRPEKR